jgi:hypothetical protein
VTDRIDWTEETGPSLAAKATNSTGLDIVSGRVVRVIPSLAMALVVESTTVGEMTESASAEPTATTETTPAPATAATAAANRRLILRFR